MRGPRTTGDEIIPSFCFAGALDKADISPFCFMPCGQPCTQRTFDRGIGRGTQRAAQRHRQVA